MRLLNIEEPAAAADTVSEIVAIIERASTLGFTDVVLAWPRPTSPYQGDESLMDGLAAHLPRLRSDLP